MRTGQTGSADLYQGGEDPGHVGQDEGEEESYVDLVAEAPHLSVEMEGKLWRIMKI